MISKAELHIVIFSLWVVPQFLLWSLLPTHQKMLKLLYISKFLDLVSATTESNLLGIQLYSSRSLMTTLSHTSYYVLHSRHCYTATRFKDNFAYLDLLMSYFGWPTLTGLTRCLCDVNPINFLSVTILVTTFWSMTWCNTPEKNYETLVRHWLSFFLLAKTAKTFLRHTHPSNIKSASTPSAFALPTARWTTNGSPRTLFVPAAKWKTALKSDQKFFEAKTKFLAAAKWKTALKSD